MAISGKDREHLILGPVAVAHLDPEILVLVAELLATASAIELGWTRFVAELADADHAVTAAMLDTVLNPNGRREVVEAVAIASNRMWREDLPIVKRALEESRAVADSRNEYAHHIWGFVKSKPKTLLLLDPSLAALDEVAKAKFLAKLGRARLQLQNAKDDAERERLTEQLRITLRWSMPLPNEAAIAHIQARGKRMIDEQVRRASRMMEIVFQVTSLPDPFGRAKALAELSKLLPPPGARAARGGGSKPPLRPPPLAPPR